MSKNDGGPAFPVPVDNFLDAMNHPRQGMTLRDWFAGMAMQGVLSAEISKEGSATISNTAKDAYKMADAMLAEREKS